jgi:hypothetical protein
LRYTAERGQDKRRIAGQLVITPRRAVARLAQDDAELLQDLAACRGALTLADYATRNGVSRSGAWKRLSRGLAVALDRVELTIARDIPSVLFPKRGFGRVSSPTYREAQTLHEILDSLLRYQVHRELLVARWQHHSRLPALAEAGDVSHLVDCLDRAPRSIWNAFATQLTKRGTVLHTGDAARASYFRSRLAKSARAAPTPAPSPPAEPLSWDALFTTPRRELAEPETRHEGTITLHELPAFRVLARQVPAH